MKIGSRKILCISSLLLVLAGCGGGGSSGDSPSANGGSPSVGGGSPSAGGGGSPSTGGGGSPSTGGGGSPSTGGGGSPSTGGGGSPSTGGGGSGGGGTISAGLSGWPKYLAMGTLSNAVTYGTAAEPTNVRIDSIFTYNDDGSGGTDIIENPYKIYNMVTYASQIKSSTGHNVNPAIVEYTWDLSGGWNDDAVTNQSQLVKHLFNLAFLAKSLGSDSTYKSTGTYGTILLNPDWLGYIGNTSRQLTVSGLNINVNQAVEAVYNLMTQSNTYACSKKTVSGTPLDVYNQQPDPDNWDKGADFASCMNLYINQNLSSLVSLKNVQVPQFTNNVQGWIQAQYWLIKTFAPNTPFGWHDNISGVTNGSWWIHSKNPQGVSDYAAAALKDMNSFQLFNGKLKPDFIYFDRYGADDYSSQNASVTNSYATLYTAKDWDKVLQVVKLISEGIGAQIKQPFMPVMLWQIPAAHIPTQSEVKVSPLEEGSAPVYFFGDPQLQANLSNIDHDIGNVMITAPQYEDCNNITIKQCLSQDNYDWSKDNGKLQQAVNSHVFSILWGAGGYATGVWPVTGSFADNGWMEKALAQYYTKYVN
jgi:hypothetical protein